MNTEILIHDLASKCRPVKPVAPPLRRFLIWASATIVLLVIGVLIFRPRPDISSVVFEPSFVIPAMAMLCLSFLSALSAFFLTVPDQRSRRFDVIPITVVIFWFGLIAYTVAFSDLENSSPGLICMMRIVCLSIAPAALLFYMLNKAAPLRPGLIGLLAGLGALTFAEVGVQFLCHKTFWAHIFVWHFLPVCAFALIGVLVGRLIFRINVNRSVTK